MALVAGAAVAADGSRAVDSARAYVQQQRQALGLTAADVGEQVVKSVVESRHSGVTHVYLQQRHRGIEVYNGVVNVNVGRDGRVINAGSRAVSNIALRAGFQTARLSAVEAAAAAAGHLGLRPTAPFQVLERKGGADDATTLSDGGIATRPIDAKLVWQSADGAVRLAWLLEIEEARGEHWWYALVDATTGASLGQDDLIVHDSAEATAARDRASLRRGRCGAVVRAHRRRVLQSLSLAAREPERRRPRAGDRRRQPHRLAVWLARHRRGRGSRVHRHARQQRSRLRRPRRQQHRRSRQRSATAARGWSSTSRSTSSLRPVRFAAGRW